MKRLAIIMLVALLAAGGDALARGGKGGGGHGGGGGRGGKPGGGSSGGGNTGGGGGIGRVGGGGGYVPMDVKRSLQGQPAPSGYTDDEETMPKAISKPTKEEQTAALEAVRAEAKAAQDKLHLKLAEASTDHFVIFTNWNTTESEVLKRELERSYALVIKALDMPAKESAFTGKLPVYAIADEVDFKAFADSIDKASLTKGNAGGYVPQADKTQAHLLMTRRVTGDDATASDEQQWRWMLDRSMTYALLDRDRTDRRLPAWLAQGLADVISDPSWPRTMQRQLAFHLSQSNDFSFIDLVNGKLTDGNSDPAMQTLVEMLVSKDRKAFVSLVNAIKDGRDVRSAIKETYHSDYTPLESAWKQYVKQYEYVRAGS
ncbi:MAG TPA: hypothetical protein VIL86_20965 [Tepidisphaeraceae bacterium]